MDLLPLKKLQRLLTTSLRIYIDNRKNADTKELEYTYCPTSGYNAVYRATAAPSDSGDILFCSKCLSSIRTTCWTPRHLDITCKTNKRNIAESTEAVAFAQFKAENELKDCPKCNMSIQKSDSCNHMLCNGCNAHICQVCMEVFDTAGGFDGCYAHMKAVHGGIWANIPPEA